jgi:ssDNA-binding Zn-finger/Zn-ribbon topoisomerase 1
MADLWEPFLFVDLYQQARAEKVRETTEHVVRQLQCMEFELLFRHCYEAATGEPLSKPSDRSASSDQESGIARVRRLRDRHRPKHRTSDRAASDRSKSKDSKAAAESPGQIAVVCPKCRKSLTLPDSARGKNQRCGKCSAIFTVPGKKGPGGPKASPAAARTIAVRCPKCGSTLKAPESARGRTERCAKCGARFMIPKKPAGGVPAAAGKA